MLYLASINHLLGARYYWKLTDSMSLILKTTPWNLFHRYTHFSDNKGGIENHKCMRQSRDLNTEYNSRVFALNYFYFF